MSGCYDGLQALIKSRNLLADLVLCAAHSLNLIGSVAAESYAAATSYFMFVNEMHSFLTASTLRYDIFKSEM